MKELGAVAQEALSRAVSAEGRVIRATQLLDVANRALADQTLKRLEAHGYLVRLGRGLYALPVESKFGPIVERDESFIRGLELLHNEKIADSGAMEALGLGITTQVPVRTVYWTSGKSRKYRMKKSTIEFRHMPHAVVAIEGEWGRIVRAIAGGFNSSTDLKALAKKVKGVSPPAGIFALRGELGMKVRSIIEINARVASS